MRGFAVFLGKEITEIRRTWRMWVLPLIMVAFGVLSPIVAAITPQLVDSLAGSQVGVVIEIPDPVTADAYLQFSKNNMQIALLAIIISMAGMVSGERKSGTAVLVLVKPLSRSAFVTAKVVSNWGLVIVSTLLGWVAALATTALLFDVELLSEFARATSFWLVLALTFVSVMALMSVAISSQAGAAGAGLGVYLVVAVLSGWGPARDNTLAGLYTAGDRLVMGEDPTLLWPMVTALIVSLLCVALATVVFRRQEL
jgi:ABC-2 type transport system permease protein